MGITWILGLISLGAIGWQVLKESNEPVRHYTPPKQDKPLPKWSEPKYENGKLVIDDYYQYKQDWQKYGIMAAQQYAEQGKYNMPKGQYRDAHSPEIKYVIGYEPEVK